MTALKIQSRLDGSMVNMRATLRTRCQVETIPDPRLMERERLMNWVRREVPWCSQQWRSDVDLCAVEAGTGSILERIFEEYRGREKERYGDIDGERIQHIKTMIQKIIWIDESLAIVPARERKVITTMSSSNKTIIDVARARRLMVRAKKQFEVTDDTQVIEKAAILVAFSEGEDSLGVKTAAAVITSAAGAPTDKLLDKLSLLEESFEKLGKADEA